MTHDGAAPRGPDEDDDLLWYHVHSAAAVGLHAQSYRDIGTTQHEPQGPTGKQCAAAFKQSKIMRLLGRCRPLERKVLYTCYTGPEPPPNVVHECGYPLARVVMACERAGVAVVNGVREKLHGAVWGAHQAYQRQVELAREERVVVRATATTEREAERASEPDRAQVNQHDLDVAVVAAWMRGLV